MTSFFCRKMFLLKSFSKRCNNCHKDEGIQEAFTHIFHRFKKTTSLPALDIVELCASCHADKDFHNVVGFTGSQAEAVKTYKETIHYRILQFGGVIPHTVSAAMHREASMISEHSQIPSHQSTLIIASKPVRQENAIPLPLLRLL